MDGPGQSIAGEVGVHLHHEAEVTKFVCLIRFASCSLMRWYTIHTFSAFLITLSGGIIVVVGNTPMTNNATGVYVVLIKSLSDSINLRFLLANIFPPLVYQRRR